MACYDSGEEDEGDSERYSEDLYLAEGLTFGETDPDEDEFLELERVPLSELVERVMSGEITDGKTQVAILKVNEILRRRETEAKGNGHDQA